MARGTSGQDRTYGALACRPGEGALAQADERPALLALCGAVGLLGAVGLVGLGLVAQVQVPGHDPVAETISDLGDGPGARWMDLGFYVQATGLGALGVGAAHAHVGRWGWSLGVLALLLLGVVVALLGAYDEFHTGPVPPEAYTVHTRLTFTLVPLYVAGMVGTAAGAARVARPLGPVFLGAAAALVLFGPAFYLVPDGIDGLVERLLLVPGLVWTLSLSGLFLDRARKMALQG